MYFYRYFGIFSPTIFSLHKVFLCTFSYHRFYLILILFTSNRKCQIFCSEIDISIIIFFHFVNCLLIKKRHPYRIIAINPYTGADIILYVTQDGLIHTAH